MKLARTVNCKTVVWNWVWPWHVFWVLLRVCACLHTQATSAESLIANVKRLLARSSSCHFGVTSKCDQTKKKGGGVNTYPMSAVLYRLWYSALRRTGASLVHFNNNCNMYVPGETQCDCLFIFRPRVLCSRLTDFEKFCKQSSFVADWPDCTLC